MANVCDICGNQVGALKHVGTVAVGDMTLHVCDDCTNALHSLYVPSAYQAARDYLEDLYMRNTMIAPVANRIEAAVLKADKAMNGGGHPIDWDTSNRRGHFEYDIRRVRNDEQGRIDLNFMQQALDEAGKEGWRLREVFSNHVGTAEEGKVSVDESVLIFERWVEA